MNRIFKNKIILYICVCVVVITINACIKNEFSSKYIGYIVYSKTAIKFIDQNVAKYKK